VSGSPAKHDAVRALGTAPLDYHSDGLVAHVRALASGEVDAVFDHVGGRSLRDG